MKHTLSVAGVSVFTFLLTLPMLRADLVSLAGGTLSIQYDGGVFADVANSSTILDSAEGDFLRYGRFWSAAETVGSAPGFLPRQPQAFRPLPFSTPTGNPRQPNFRDNRAALEALFPEVSPTENLWVNGNEVIAPSLGRNRLSTTLSFDPLNLEDTVTGFVQTNGVSAWWFANDALMDSGIAWISWGDLSLRFDETREALGYSGWVFANQLGGVGDIFDTKLTSLLVSPGGLVLEGELYSSDGSSPDPYNENFATWETYTLMKPNVKIGTFRFSGVAVPEPGSGLMIASGVATLLLGRRRSVVTRGSDGIQSGNRSAKAVRRAIRRGGCSIGSVNQHQLSCESAP